MIAWLNPAALALATVAAVPLVIHLLLRRRATRVLFPSIRFIAASDRSAIRMRRPSDVLLLVIRMAIVALAAMAVAKPLLLTDARARALGERTIRAIVVDTTPSVDGTRAREAATAETQGAAVFRQFDDDGDLRRSIERAVEWFGAAEPGLREIVVLSDFQRGALTAVDFARVPPGIGVRTVRIASASDRAVTFEAPAVFHEGSVYTRTVRTEDASTVVTLRPSSAATGLELNTDASRADRITRTIASAGALAPSAAQPLTLRFNASQTPHEAGAWKHDWSFAAARRLFASPVSTAIPFRVSPGAGGLLIDAETPADSFDAAQLTQAALNARFAFSEIAEREPATLPQDVLDSWARRPSPPDANAWRHSHESDGRWLWMLSLVLLVVEGFARRVRSEPRAMEAHAA